MSELLLQIFLLVFLIIVLIYIFIKEIKKRIKRQKIGKSSIQNNNSEEIKIENSVKTQELRHIDKLLVNLEEMIDRNDEVNSISNKENLNFFSTVINNDSSFIHSTKETLTLDEKELKAISKHLDLKLGSELSSMVQRVDKDGNIILGMEALKFITGEHIPLITPNGSIRVLNLLSIEDDIMLSIETGKPIFLVDNKNKSIRRFEKDEIDIFVKYNDEFELKSIVNNKEKELKNLTERNSYLENQVDELKNTILKLETQNEIYQQLTQSNEIYNFNKKNKSKEDDKASLDINTNKFKVDNKNISTNTQNLSLPTAEEIITNQNEVQYLAKDDYSEMNFSSTTKSLTQLTEKIDLFDEVKIENSKNDIQIKDDTKTLTKKVAEKFINIFFLEYLMRKNGGDNRNVLVEDLIFITYEQELFTKTYYLKYLYKNTVEELKKFLIENGYKDDEYNINQILNIKNIEVKNDVYFSSSKDKQLYKSKIIKAKFTQDEITPFALINEKQNGYTGGFTQSENEKLMESVLDKKIYAIYQRNLNNIANNNFIILD